MIIRWYKVHIILFMVMVTGCMFCSHKADLARKKFKASKQWSHEFWINLCIKLIYIGNCFHPFWALPHTQNNLFQHILRNAVLARCNCNNLKMYHKKMTLKKFSGKLSFLSFFYFEHTTSHSPTPPPWHSGYDSVEI